MHKLEGRGRSEHPGRRADGFGEAEELLQVLPSPDCARNKQVAHRERAACGEEKVEEGNKRGRKQRGDEAIAVK